MSFPRTVSWPVFQPGWSRALTELTTMSLALHLYILGDMVAIWPLAFAYAMQMCNRLASPLSVWILYFVGLLCNIAHGHTTCKVLQAHCEQKLLFRSSTLQIDIGFKVLDLCGYL